MIGIENEFLGKEVMAPVAEGLNEGVELMIVFLITTMYFVKLLAKILNRVFVLTKNTANTNSGGIARDLEDLREIW